MDSLHKLVDIVDDNKSKLSEHEYIRICNLLKAVYTPSVDPLFHMASRITRHAHAKYNRDELETRYIAEIDGEIELLEEYDPNCLAIAMIPYPVHDFEAFLHGVISGG